ncbi:DUF1684 domain-containing protein [Luteimonas terricola]|uniref:DUF1684 domain-containing protein n=1 Tax=Luteimonas terricola TaxID=645597 RepID=A0ABQ2EDY8_9GAMM|nr:DUF1684 domain-containing protein [Luteimonas terricola]GGK08393.1 hypothetical protein GCM10011394_17140 [Luteimonas terricola]
MTRSTPRTATAVTCLVLAAVLAACGSAAPPGDADGDDAPAPEASPELIAAEQQWRAARREYLLAEDGWTSVVGLHWLELRAHYIGSSQTSGIRLAQGPEKLGLVQQDAGRVYFTPERDVAVTHDDAPVTGRIELRDDHDDAGPVELVFDDGRGRLSLISRGARRALRVKHADAPARTNFGAIAHWPVDAGWVLDGRFVPHPAGRSIEIGNIVGGVDPMPNPGVVEFSRDGVDYRLEALEGSEGGLFLILADRTSGHDSYGAGRYLDTAAPDAQGRVTLNFNRTYNPPCAFTDFATCPLPPPENRLDLAVTAGEQAYARPAHAAPGS